MLRLLEDVALPELVIQLATLAISEAVNDTRSQVGHLQETISGPRELISLQFYLHVMYMTARCECLPLYALQAALWTRIFKHHLDLGHNSQAYEALVQNPDQSRY